MRSACSIQSKTAALLMPAARDPFLEEHSAEKRCHTRMHSFVDNIFVEERPSGTFVSAAVDRIGCSSYPFRTIQGVFVSNAHSKPVALRNASGVD